MANFMTEDALTLYKINSIYALTLYEINSIDIMGCCTPEHSVTTFTW